MDDPHEQARIIRIARAMCRSRRLDPDQPLEGSVPAVIGGRPLVDSLTSNEIPTWLLFVSEAKKFVAANQDSAAQL